MNLLSSNSPDVMRQNCPVRGLTFNEMVHKLSFTNIGESLRNNKSSCKLKVQSVLQDFPSSLKPTVKSNEDLKMKTLYFCWVSLYKYNWFPRYY